MARELTVLTPENIPLRVELAGLGTRFAALFVDLVALFSGLIVVVIIGAALIGALSTVGVGDYAIAVLILVVFVTFFGSKTDW